MDDENYTLRLRVLKRRIGEQFSFTGLSPQEIREEYYETLRNVEETHIQDKEKIGVAMQELLLENVVEDIGVSEYEDNEPQSLCTQLLDCLSSISLIPNRVCCFLSP